MNKIRKAVITAAGRGTRMYPATTTIQKEMLPVMDRDGICKPAIQIIIEEALDSGIEEVCLVVNPHNRAQIEQHFAPLSPEELRLFKGKDWALLQSARIQQIASRLHFVVQEKAGGLRPRGLSGAEFRRQRTVSCDAWRPYFHGGGQQTVRPTDFGRI